MAIFVMDKWEMGYKHIGVDQKEVKAITQKKPFFFKRLLAYLFDVVRQDLGFPASWQCKVLAANRAFND
jgi:hypothetical protein